MQLIQGGGHGQAQVVQPLLVHPELGGDGAVIALVDHGQAVDVAIQLGDQALGARILFKDLVDEVALGLDQVVQGQEGALADAVLGDHGVVHAAHQEDVRIVAAGQDQAQLLSAALVGDQLELEVHVGDFLDPLHKGIVLPGRDGRMVSDGHGQLDVAEVIAQLVRGQVLVQLGFRLPGKRRGRAAQQHGDRQQQNQQFLHSVLPPFILHRLPPITIV